MTFYMIGIGLADKEDITIKGLNAIKQCDTVFLEHYTSILPNIKVEELEAFYEKSITLASRDLVEKESDTILKDNTAFLVIGDVFGATTHTDLYLRAKEKGLDVKVINNASIMNAVGNTGLELYKFGKTTSMVFFEGDWKPRNVYDVIKQNKSQGLHTLVLLDIKVAEPSKEAILKGTNQVNPPRFMTIKEALNQLLELEDIHKEEIISEDLVVLGCARIGSQDAILKAGLLKDIKEVDFGGPLHALIIPGNLHHIEQEVLDLLE